MREPPPCPFDNVCSSVKSSLCCLTDVLSQRVHKKKANGQEMVSGWVSGSCGTYFGARSLLPK